MIVDLTGCRFLDSRGLRALIAARERLERSDRSLALVLSNPIVMRIFQKRAHAARPVVLDKLRYMRGGEPLSGYDTLTTEQIAKALARADAETVKAVRDYERKLQRRQSALDETARVLPTSRASAGEERPHEEKVGAPVWVVDH